MIYMYSLFLDKINDDHLQFRYYRNHFAKKDDLTISQFRQKIVISVSSFCFMAHLIACVFYYVSSCSLHIPENLQQQRDSNSPCPVGTWTYICELVKYFDLRTMYYIKLWYAEDITFCYFQTLRKLRSTWNPTNSILGGWIDYQFTDFNQIIIATVLLTK
jgi:hypothetical protein